MLLVYELFCFIPLRHPLTLCRIRKRERVFYNFIVPQRQRNIAVSSNMTITAEQAVQRHAARIFVAVAQYPRVCLAFHSREILGETLAEYIERARRFTHSKVPFTPEFMKIPVTRECDPRDRQKILTESERIKSRFYSDRGNSRRTRWRDGALSAGILNVGVRRTARAVSILELARVAAGCVACAHYLNYSILRFTNFRKHRFPARAAGTGNASRDFSSFFFYF